MGNATSDLFDPLVATVSELQKLLKDFEVTTIQLVETYLEEIETNNGYIHAVISTAPQELMLEQAKKLDQERGQDLKSADLIEKLIEAGAIILGKANLSKLSYFK
ncbi:putative amidase family protein [Diaporthe ampelina]|uniref:Putative amidase family protein n=1 Tax=Diaporthe ampelina TaxID=1214573 RepID=A0A0G2HXH1_9PEZI|nr:putative amidase family protein [Diaporthe ampelina]